MSSTDDDDDRTLIRPPVPPAPAGAAAPVPAAGAGSPDDDRTVFAAPPPYTTEPPAPRAPSPDDDMGNALPVGTRLGEFELTGVLGEGGFGIVYLAQDHSLHRRVALKEYMPSALAARKGGTQVSVKSERHRETFEAGLKSFVNEARLLAQFDHPSLVKVYRFWEANGTAYMVMPFYEGMTLKDKLREMGSAPDEAWLRGLLAPLTEALAVIHTERCYHRDIAPDNIILLAGSGKPLLLDFGAARRVIGDMTQALTVILKPGYAPLEQYAEVPSMKQGPWTDVYALAAVVYFAIQGRTPPVSVGRMMGDSYQPLSESARGLYSPGFLAAVDRALKVRPEDRTQSIDEFRADMGLAPGSVPNVQTVMHGDAAPAASPAPARGAPAAAPARAGASAAEAPRSKSGLWIGLGAGALVLGGVGAFFALTPGTPPPAPAPVATAPAPAPAAATDPVAQGTAPAPTAPPAAAETPAPAPVANAPFSVDREFDRIVQAATPGFTVEAASAKPQLRIGRDRLRYTVTSSRDGYVYTLVKGPDGSLLLLHPNTLSRGNRISAGQPLVLPPADAPLDTSEPAGREDFLILVSAVPRSFDHLKGKRDTFLFLPTGAEAEALAAAHGGPGSTFAGRPGNCEGEACTAYGAVRFSVDVVK